MGSHCCTNRKRNQPNPYIGAQNLTLDRLGDEQANRISYQERISYEERGSNDHNGNSYKETYMRPSNVEQRVNSALGSNSFYQF